MTQARRLSWLRQLDRACGEDKPSLREALGSVGLDGVVGNVGLVAGEGKHGLAIRRIGLRHLVGKQRTLAGMAARLAPRWQLETDLVEVFLGVGVDAAKTK